MKRFHHFPVLTTVFVVWMAIGLSEVLAQDNRIPLNWRNLTVQVIETYGNNNTRPLRGAKVKVELKDPSKLDSLRKIYPTLRLPAQRTAQTRGALFGKLPPSSVVGPYIVTVIPKPYDRKKEYTCVEEQREIRMGGGSDQRLTFNFECKKADIKNEFKRRAKGGYDLSVKLEQNTGTRGAGYWVYLYDKDGNRIKKVRTGGNATAVFKAIDPNLNPYKVEVYRINTLLHSSEYEMPEQHSTYTIDLNKR